MFAKLSVKYSHKFTSAFPDDPTLHAAQDEWAESLAGLEKQQLRQGLDKCIDIYPSWPPTVGEFKKLCEVDPVKLGLPSVESALREVTCSYVEFGESVKQYSHGVILATAKDPSLDTFSLRQMSLEKAMKTFKPVYSKYVQKALSGEEFLLPIMIEDKVNKTVTKEERLVLSDKWIGKLKDATKGD